jgi:hypothetical protein
MSLFILFSSGLADVIRYPQIDQDVVFRGVFAWAKSANVAEASAEMDFIAHVE